MQPSVPYCSGITGNGNPNLTLDFTDRKVNKQIANILLGNQTNSISLYSIPPSVIFHCLTERRDRESRSRPMSLLPVLLSSEFRE